MLYYETQNWRIVHWLKVTMKAAPKENYWNIHSQEDTPEVASEDPSIHYAQFFYVLNQVALLGVKWPQVEKYSWLKQLGLALHGSIYTQIFFPWKIHYSSVNLSSLVTFLTNIFSLAYWIVKIQYIIHITHKICVNWLFMLLVRLSINSMLLSFGESKVILSYLSAQGVSALNLLIVQGSLLLVR